MGRVVLVCLDAEPAAPTCALTSALAGALARVGLACDAELLGATDAGQGVPALLQRLAGARYVALVITRAWQEHPFALAPLLGALTEMAQARPGHRPFLLPLRLEPCPIPHALAHLQHADLFASGGIERIVERLAEDLRLFTDVRDGSTYPTVTLGGRIWLARNLAYDLDADGVSWPARPAGGGAAPGRLYSWRGAHVACPPGWHLPTETEWRDLALDAGGYRDMDAGYPREGVSVGKPEQAFDALTRGGRSGFDAELAGVRTASGSFEEAGRIGAYWTGTAHQYDTLQSDFAGLVRTAWMYIFYTLGGRVQLRRDHELPLVHSSAPLDQRWGLSVRCVRDRDGGVA